MDEVFLFQSVAKSKATFLVEKKQTMKNMEYQNEKITA